MARKYSPQYHQNKKIVLGRDDSCVICKKYIDKTVKYPNEFSPSVHHWIPVDRGGGDNIENLYLSHLICNKLVSNSLPSEVRNRDIEMAVEQRMNQDVIVTGKDFRAMINKTNEDYENGGTE